VRAFEQVPIASVKAYWDSRPCNLRHSNSPVGSKEYFDEVETRKYLVEPHIPGFAQFERWDGKRVLEIGCGLGTDTINFARAGATVTAVDLSSASIELATKRAEVFGVGDRIRFVQGDAESLSNLVAVEPFDLVYSFGVIHHSPHPDRALREMRKFLAPSGEMKIMVYNQMSWKVGAIIVTEGHGRFWDRDALVARSSEAQTSCPVTYTYTRRTGRQLLEAEDLAVTKMSVDHIFPYRIDDYVAYRYVKSWQFRHLPEPVFSWLEHRLGWHLCLTATATAA
jgi:ubiquinone/menaquinone biosynthesis C-methylase UbiE